MDNNDSTRVANQTEIPVSEVKNSSSNKPKNKIPKVLLLAVIVVVIVSIPLIFLNSSSSKKARVAALSAQAQKESSSGKFAQAKKDLDQAIAIDKNNPRLLSQQIQTIALEGNQTGTEKQAFEEAKPYINQIIQNKLGDADVLMSIGYAYETVGDYNKALTYYEGATKLAPKSADAWFHLGHVQQFLGKNDEAQKDYDKAYSLDKNNPLVLMAMGNMFFSRGKTQEAFDSFKKASELPGISVQTKSETLTSASIVRGTQILHMKEAVDLAKQAIDTDPGFSPALGNYAYLSFLNGNAKDGGTYVQKAIIANPRISKNYYILAQMLRFNKKFADAINYQKKAISLVANDNTLLGPAQKDGARALYTYDLAKTYDTSGLKADIIPLLVDALKANPNLKATLINDYKKYNFFKSLSQDPRFIQLIITQV